MSHCEFFCFLLLLCLFTGKAAWCQTRGTTPYRVGMTLTEYVKTVSTESGDPVESKNTVAIFIEFLKFGCLPCLNDFLDFCDTLQAVAGRGAPCDVVLIFKQDHQENTLQYQQMKSWVKAIGMNFRFRIAPPDLFSGNYISEISLLILDRNFRYVYFNRFPLTPIKQHEILEILCDGENDTNERR